MANSLGGVPPSEVIDRMYQHAFKVVDDRLVKELSERYGKPVSKEDAAWWLVGNGIDRMFGPGSKLGELMV